MKSGSGSSSPNEDVSRYQPFTHLCLRKLNEFGDALIMPALSSTVLITSDQNYQAMLTTEPLDTAKHRRRPCRLIHSLRLPDEQRHRRGTTLTCAAPVGGHGTARTPRALSTGAPGSASPTSGCICTRRLRTARMYGHTHGWDVASWRGSGESRRIGR